MRAGYPLLPYDPRWSASMVRDWLMSGSTTMDPEVLIDDLCGEAGWISDSACRSFEYAEVAALPAVTQFVQWTYVFGYAKRVAVGLPADLRIMFAEDVDAMLKAHGGIREFLSICINWDEASRQGRLVPVGRDVSRDLGYESDEAAGERGD